MSFTASGVCVCDSGYTETGVESLGDKACILSTEANAITPQYPVSQAITVNYYDVEFRAGGALGAVTGVDSLWFNHLYLRSAVNCWNYRGPEDLPHCQTLGNLCALQLYNPDATVCRLFSRIATARPGSLHGFGGWSPSLPFLMYRDDGLGVTEDRGVQMRVAFNNNSDSSDYEQLRFVLSKYTLNGTWLGFEPLGWQLQYCQPAPGATSTGPSRDTRFLRFGHNHSQKYLCDLRNLLTSGGEPLLYDLYLVDERGGTDSAASSHPRGHVPALFPVAVRLRHYRDSDSAASRQPNRNRQPDTDFDDVFHRRFFLWETFSGLTDSSSGAQPDVMRYAAKIHLQIKIRDDDSELIYPPVLSIVYRERQPADLLTSSNLYKDDIVFEVEYTMDTSTFWDTATGFFVTCLVLVLLLWLYRMYSWQRHCALEMGDSDGQYFPLRALEMLSSAFAAVFVWYLFVFSAYWYLFYKMSNEVHTLLPQEHPEYGREDEYYPFGVLLYLCFFFHLLHVLRVVYDQTKVEMFFVDWEQPRGRGVGGGPGSVSVWRTLLVANEWAEMQTQRQTSSQFTLLWAVYLLAGAQLQNLATAQPDASDLSDGKLNPVLRFFNTTLWILTLSYGQRLWNFLIGERYIGEPKSHEFIDLCTMAKISILLLPDRYHGYYLHCRSPHTHADGDMLNMVEQLRSEEERSAGARGMEGGPPGVQTFELHATASFRRRYSSIYAQLQGSNAAERAREAGRLGHLRGKETKHNRKAPPEKMVRAARRLNKFLRNWVDQNEPSFKRAFGDYTSLLERVLEWPPEMGNAQASLLYPDPEHKFTRVLFLGIETELVVLNVLTFAISDMWFQNSVTSGLLTYLLEKGLSHFRSHFGKVNMADKTMVDERFLI